MASPGVIRFILFYVTILSYYVLSSSSASSSPLSVDQSSDLAALIKLQEKSLSYDKASYELLYFVSEKLVFFMFLSLIAIIVYLFSKLNECCCKYEKTPPHAYTRV